jgi:hypothetical protein
MSDPTGITPPAGEFLVYVADDGQVRVQVRLEGETVWLTQAAIGELFQTTPQNVTMHLAAIYEEAELEEAATCKDFLQVRREGRRDVRRSLKHYNLAAVLAVGYRVRSAQGTRFRQWATARLQEYVVKGFAMDDQRLKNPPGPDRPDYFDELLARIRDIRSSAIGQEFPPKARSVKRAPASRRAAAADSAFKAAYRRVARKHRPALKKLAK